MDDSEEVGVCGKDVEFCQAKVVVGVDIFCVDMDKKEVTSLVGTC